jgi:hypothetical protein
VSNAVIAATGLFTPEQSVSNAELVDSYNAWADGWNARHAAQSSAVSPVELVGPCNRYESICSTPKCPSELANDCSTWTAMAALGS